MKFDTRTAKVAKYFPLVADGQRGAPISLQVALTDSCFNRCIGCGHPLRVQRKMEVQRYLDFLAALPGPVESVCYSGGDPMAYPEFNAVMRWHVDHGMPFGMTITGYVPPTLDRALLKQAAWIRCSLDAVDEQVYAKVRGKTPLRKVLANIEELIALGANVQLGITVHPDNEAYVADVLEWGKARGITRMDTRYAYPASNPRWPDVDSSTRGVQRFNHCHAALYQLYLDSDGSVFPCCITAGDTRAEAQGHALGNVFTQPWSEIWAAVVDYSRRELAQLPEICRTCCVQRLSEINHVCDQLSVEKSFF
jgi:radical SAM protein with 4Fe4S-binding SPASM domain